METIALNLRPPLLRDAHFSLQMTFNCCLDALSKKPCTSSTSATNHFTAASRTRTKTCAEDAPPCSIKFPEPDLSTHWCKSSRTTSARSKRSWIAWWLSTSLTSRPPCRSPSRSTSPSARRCATCPPWSSRGSTTSTRATP